MMIQRSFCVISGGPGTGKTFTVVKILALMIEQALRRQERPPRVTLIAPTGKAVAVGYIDLWRLEGGRAVENWVQMDLLGLMQQLGVVSAPGQAAG